MKPLKPIRVDAFLLTLVDYDTVTDEERTAARDIAFAELRAYLGSVRKGTRLCSNEMDIRREEKLRAALVNDPYLDQAKFLATLDPGELVEDDSDPDPRLGMKWFIATHDTEGLVGVFGLYNIRVTEGDPEQWSAMLMPGLRDLPGTTKAQVMGTLMDLALRNTVEAQDGSLANLVEWRFPTRPDQRWSLDLYDEDPLGGAILGVWGHDITIDEGVPVSSKRQE